jgi:hypothetical protein
MGGGSGRRKPAAYAGQCRHTSVPSIGIWILDLSVLAREDISREKLRLHL